MTKKEARQLAKQKIKEGKTQQQAFDEIKATSDRPAEEIADIVKAIPTLDARQKNKTLNYILIGLLALTILFKMLLGIPIVLQNGIIWLPIIFLLPIINILMLVGVSTFSTRAHWATGLFSLLALLRSLGDILGKPFEPLMLIDFALIGVLLLNYQLSICNLTGFIFHPVKINSTLQIHAGRINFLVCDLIFKNFFSENIV